LNYTDIITFIVCILFSAFFSGTETSLFSLTNLKLEAIKEKHSNVGRIISILLNHPQKLLVTILICNIGVNISATLLAIKIFPKWLAIPLVTLLIILFGEISPKTIAINISDKLSILVAPIIYFLFKILTPFSYIFHNIAKGLVYINSKVFYKNIKEPSIYQYEEMLDAIKEGEDIGTIDKEEGNILSNLIRFSDSEIYKATKPRREIFSISIDKSISEIIDLIKEKNYSRVPIWEDNEENIIGILYARDLLNIKGIKRTLSYYRRILKKPFFIPDSIKAEKLFKMFRASQKHMAIVINEYGGIEGLITLEDVIEEIIGEIVDRDDIKPLYHKYNPRMIEVEAKMEISELNKIFKTNIKSKDFISIGGYILEKIKRIPNAGETIILNNLQFKIYGAKPNKIESILITKINKNRKKKKGII
jgi:putative hemolysin